MIAKAMESDFGSNPEILVFASGVSNSNETAPEPFNREKTLLEHCLAKRTRIVYFSTCSIEDPALKFSRYVRHKLEMEALLLERGNCAIYRLPQVVGLTANRNTLTNYLYNCVKEGTPFQLWSDAKRYLIDVHHVSKIISHVEKSRGANLVMNIAPQDSVKISHIVDIFEDFLNKKANYTTAPMGGCYKLNIDRCQIAAEALGIDLKYDYAKKCLEKYYGH